MTAKDGTSLMAKKKGKEPPRMPSGGVDFINATVAPIARYDPRLDIDLLWEPGDEWPSGDAPSEHNHACPTCGQIHHS